MAIINDPVKLLAFAYADALRSKVHFTHNAPPKHMTYKQLLNQLQQLEEWQLESDVILWNGNFDEYCEKCSLTFASDTQDVFDEGTPLICF